MNLKTKYFLIFLALFMVSYWFRLKETMKFNFQSGERIKITSRLSQEPTVKDNKQVFKIQNIIVQTNLLPEFHYGDYLIITGKIKKKVINNFFNQFLLLNPTIVKVETDNNLKDFLFVFLFKLRSRIENIFEKTLPEPQASLLIGILLGIQKSLALDFYQSLQTTGTFHIIVASGMNISLTAGLLTEFLAKFLKRKIALIVSLSSILLYCIMAGLAPSIIRAGMMAAILALASFTGRERNSLLALFIVGAVMLLINPLLLFDAGFELSFVATAGLITLGPFFEKIFSKLTSSLANDLAETTSAQILTLPILIITFGHFNPLSIIPNVFVLWLAPFLMILALLIAFSGLIFFPLAQFLSWLAWLPLSYFIQIISFFGKFKLFDLKFEGFSWIFGLGYYLILFSLLTIKKRRNLGIR